MTPPEWCSIHMSPIAARWSSSVSGDDPVVGLVGVEGAGITGSQLQRRGSLPVVFEAVEVFELVDLAVGAQFGEQAAPADGLQLAVVADEHEAPLVRLGETDELMQRRGGRTCRPRRRRVSPRGRAGTRAVAAGRAVATRGAVWRRCRRASRCPVRVPGPLSPSGRHRTPADGGRAGRRRRRRASGSCRHRPGRPPTRDGRRRPPRRRRRPATHRVRPDRRCLTATRFGLSIHRPGDNPLLLDEHRLGREPRRRRLDPQRATIRVSTLRRVGRIQVDAAFEHLVGGVFDRRCPAVSRHLRHGTVQVTDRLDDIGPAPRRVLRRHRLDNVGDGQRVRRGTVGGGPPDVLDEPFDGPADRLPPRPATVSPDRRHRARTCGPGYRPRLHAPGRHAPSVTVPGPPGDGTRRA